MAVLVVLAVKVMVVVQMEKEVVLVVQDLSWNTPEEDQERMPSWFLLKREETILTSCL